MKIGFKINPTRNPLYTHLINYAPGGNEGQQFFRLLAPLGITEQEQKRPEIKPAPNVALPRDLEEEISGLTASGRYAVIHPGASTVYKQWGIQKYKELGEHLNRDHELGIVVVGDKDGQAGSGKIAGTPSGMCRANGLTLEQTAHLVKQSEIFIGSDSGLAHLAAALDIPTVVLFGPSDHLKWGIESPRNRIVRKELPCSPCFIFGYHKPCRRVDCMARITVDEVARAVEEALRAGGRGNR